MPTIDSTQLFPQVDRYWDLVNKTLEKMLPRIGSTSVDNLRKCVDDLRREVSQSSAEEQVIFYHAEPLDVAADLAGGEPPTNDDIGEYKRLAQQEGWWSP
jgi:hypothetical protein